MEFKAAIVAVGSELLNGQIVNRNAAWLSKRLNDLGIEVDCHVTVNDSEDQISSFLEKVSQNAGMILVTGGLGPTSDDLTRQAVSRWAGQPLRFDEQSWRQIQDYFQRLNVALPESNKQQCYFPDGAIVLENPIGTANAFKLVAHAKRLYILPGPPREIEVLWDKHLAAEFKSLVPTSQRITTRMWRTIGKGESAIAEMVEPLLADKDAQVAYRAHAPIIETKISYRGEITTKLTQLIGELDKVLQPWLYEKDQECLAAQLMDLIKEQPSVMIYDGLSQGFILEALSPYLRALGDSAPQVSFVTAWEPCADPEAFVEQCLSWNDDAELGLALAGYDEDERWVIGVKQGDDLTIELFPVPYPGKNAAQQQRNRRAVGALALKAWFDLI